MDQKDDNSDDSMTMVIMRKYHDALMMMKETKMKKKFITSHSRVLGCPNKFANGLFHLLINGVYWGYNPLTNLGS